MSPEGARVDVLAVGAHPDDVELGVGGLLRKLAGRGYTTGILDLTRGEMSTRGSVEERAVEAANAARILGVARRENAGLPDGGLSNIPEHRHTVVRWLRSFRPRVLLIPMAGDRHPDHNATHDLARDAAYLSGLAKIDTREEAHRPERIYAYYPYFDGMTPPTFIVDVSGEFEDKLAALRAHASQFHNPDYEGKATFISSAAFWDGITTRAEYWGRRIGVKYGEPLWAEGPVAVDILPGLEGGKS